ncbi:flagellar protein FliT [Clostridium akagii]|uniref:flagellar protein FliT n=1 Tax=Clostridium akagii TaxID=91623 RepID=UPI00047BB4AE|nr:flagellar protein FliT [Clostridium akagii]
MKDTKTLVSEYKEKTTDMLKAIEQEDYDKLNILIEERQKILDIFKENPEMYAKTEIASEFNNRDIFALDKEVSELTKKNFMEVREKLQSINSDASIKNKYNPGFSGNSLFFNKKIY